jgi:hypothetical protein
VFVKRFVPGRKETVVHVKSPLLVIVPESSVSSSIVILPELSMWLEECSNTSGQLKVVPLATVKLDDSRMSSRGTSSIEPVFSVNDTDSRGDIVGTSSVEPVFSVNDTDSIGDIVEAVSVDPSVRITLAPSLISK